MSEWQFQGSPVIDGCLAVPRSGAWVATLSVDAEKAPAPGAAVVVKLAAQEFKGAVWRGGKPYGRAQVTVIGGAGKLAKVIDAQAYRNATVRILVSDALGAAGETLSPASDAALLGTMAKAWVRARARVSDVLTGLLAPLGATWRVRADGTVWVGPETWPESKAKGVLIEECPEVGTRTYALDTFDLFGGETFDAHKVSRVEHTTGAERGRSVVWHEP